MPAPLIHELPESVHYADDALADFIDQSRPFDSGLALESLGWAVRRVLSEKDVDSNDLNNVMKKWRRAYSLAYKTNITNVGGKWAEERSEAEKFLSECLHVAEHPQGWFVVQSILSVAARRIEEAALQTMRCFWHEHWPHWLTLCWIASNGHFEDIRRRVGSIVQNGEADVRPPETSLHTSIVDGLASTPETVLSTAFEFEDLDAMKQLVDALAAGKVRALGYQVASVREEIPSDQFGRLWSRRADGRVSFCPRDARDGDPRCWRDVVFEASTVKSAFPTVEPDPDRLSEWAPSLLHGYLSPPWRQVKMPIAAAQWLDARERDDRAAMATASAAYFNGHEVLNHEAWRRLVLTAQRHVLSAAEAGLQCSPKALERALTKHSEKSLDARAADIAGECAFPHWSFSFSVALIIFNGDEKLLESAVRSYLRDQGTQGSPFTDEWLHFAGVASSFVIDLGVGSQDVEMAEKTLLDACRAGTVDAHGRMNGGEAREKIAPHEFANAQFSGGKLMSLKEGAFGQQEIGGRPTWSSVVFDAKNVRSLFADSDGQAAETSIPSPDPREFSGNAAAWYGDGGRAVVEARMRRIWPEAPKILPQGARTWFAAEIWNERCPDHPRTPNAFKEFEKRDNRK